MAYIDELFLPGENIYMAYIDEDSHLGERQNELWNGHLGERRTVGSGERTLYGGFAGWLFASAAPRSNERLRLFGRDPGAGTTAAATAGPPPPSRRTSPTRRLTTSGAADMVAALDYHRQYFLTNTIPPQT